MIDTSSMTDRQRRVIALLMLGLAVAAIAPRAGAQQSTTATYQDWTLRCAITAGSPSHKSCDMEQVAHLPNTQQPFSRVGLTRAAKGEPMTLSVQVPVNVWLATGIRIEIGGKDAGSPSPFTRCAPAGCFAAIPLTDAEIQTFRAGTATAAVVFANAAQQKVAVPLSFKGFSQAFDALAKD